MEERYLTLRFSDGYTARVKMEDDGIVLDIWVDGSVVATTWKTYEDFGIKSIKF